MKTTGQQGEWRRSMGVMCIIAGVLMSIGSGFGWYDVTHEVIWATYSAGFLLLGMGNVTDIWKK